MTAVSEGFRRELAESAAADTPNITLYNGYEPVAREAQDEAAEQGMFTFCYTGVLYEFSDFTPLLRALQRLAQEKRIDLAKVRLDYAGRDFIRLQELAQKMGMTEIQP